MVARWGQIWIIPSVLGASPRLRGCVAWMASAAFDSMIEALDIAYDVKDNRPFWKTAFSRCGDQWRPALGRARCDGSRPAVGRMAGSSTRALNRIRCSVAIPSLDHCDLFHCRRRGGAGDPSKTLPILLIPCARIEPVGREHIGKACIRRSIPILAFASPPVTRLLIGARPVGAGLYCKF